jgi:hypothetical protein
MKKEKVNSMLFGFGIGLFLVFLAFNINASTEGSKESISDGTEDDAKTLEEEPITKNDNYYTQVDPGERIKVTAIFLNPNHGEKFPGSVAFYLRFDTHSRDLYSYEIDKIVELVDREGTVYTPLSWAELEDSWSHHRYGSIEFANVDKDGRSLLETSPELKLIVRGVEQDREFIWTLE